jgi:Bardet-Biedl syndrome 2 protein
MLDINSQQGKVQISTNSIELAGEIVQDLCNFMNLTELQTSAEFPMEMDKLKASIENIELYKSAKLQLSADVAESINKIKSLVLRD